MKNPTMKPEDRNPEHTAASELHIPPEVADAIRALRPELRKKLSLRDIDDMTRPFRWRDEVTSAAIHAHEDNEGGLRYDEVPDAIKSLGKRIAELEALHAEATAEHCPYAVGNEHGHMVCRRIAELESALYSLGATIAKSGCCEHPQDEAHINNCCRENCLVAFLDIRRTLLEGE